MDSSQAGNSSGACQQSTSPRPLPPRAFRTLPTPPAASSSKEKRIIQESFSQYAGELSSGSQSAPNKSKRVESLPPDYYASQQYDAIPSPQKEPYDRSPPPDYFAPHSTTSSIAPEPTVGSEKKLLRIPNTDVAASSPHRAPQERDESSSLAQASETGVGTSSRDSTILSPGPQEIDPDVNANPGTQLGLAPLVPVRRQPEATPVGSPHTSVPSHQPKSSKSSNRASLIFRNLTHTPTTPPTGSSSSILDDTSTKSERAAPSSPGSLSGSPAHSDTQFRTKSSDTEKYPPPAKVSNILSQLDPPTASLKPQASSFHTKRDDKLPYTSPYVKHTVGASVSHMLSSLAPARDKSSGQSGSKASHSSADTQSSLSATSVATGTTDEGSTKSKSRSHPKLDVPTASTSRPASIELDSTAPRSVSPTKVAALVSSLFAPLAPLPPLASLSTSSTSSPDPAAHGCRLSASADKVTQPSTTPATQRVAAVTNLLGGLGPALHAPSVHSNHSDSAKSDSNSRSSARQQTQQEHHKNTSHISESSSTSKLSSSVPASMSALSKLNPSNLLRPSTDMKPRPFGTSAPSENHERQESSSSSTSPAQRTPAINDVPPQGSTPAATGWNNPFLALDSKVKPPLARVANASVGELPTIEAPTALHSHLNALAPDQKLNQRSKSLPSDHVPRNGRGASRTSAGTGGKKGAALSRLNLMFGSSKG